MMRFVVLVAVCLIGAVACGYAEVELPKRLAMTVAQANGIAICFATLWATRRLREMKQGAAAPHEH